MAHIEFQSVTKSYGERAVVRDFSLAVAPGERLGLLGPSGCGKTTVLRLLLGLAAADLGHICIRGQTVSANGRIIVPPEDRGIGMVFQDLALWPHLTVEANLRFGLKARKVARAAASERIGRLLRLTHLEGRAKAKPSALSGGEQQRVALARALVLEPEILAMDEPLSSLNLELNLALRGEILRLHAQLGFTLVYVTHRREEAFELATRIALMEEGQIIGCGSVPEMQALLAQLGGVPIEDRLHSDRRE